MRVIAPLTAVIERVHAPEPDLETWLEGVRSAIASSFDGQIGTEAFAVRLRESAIDLEGIARGGPHAEVIAQALSLASGGSIASYYRVGPVSRASEHIDPEDPARAIVERSGIH